MEHSPSDCMRNVVAGYRIAIRLQERRVGTRLGDGQIGLAGLRCIEGRTAASHPRRRSVIKCGLPSTSRLNAVVAQTSDLKLDVFLTEGARKVAGARNGQLDAGQTLNVAALDANEMRMPTVWVAVARNFEPPRMITEISSAQKPRFGEIDQVSINGCLVDTDGRHMGHEVAVGERLPRL